MPVFRRHCAANQMHGGAGGLLREGKTSGMAMGQNLVGTIPGMINRLRWSIPDASRRPPPTPQDFGCITFLWGLSREICQKVDVVWVEKLQSLW